MSNIDELITSRTEIPQSTLNQVKREKRNWFLTRQECLHYKLINFDGNLSDVYTALFPEEDKGKTDKELE
jgi:hypothetical protein